jgi:hypothetical protein
MFRFLKFTFIFLLIVSWLMSGWPRIWQNPRIPPEVQQAQAQEVAPSWVGWSTEVADATPHVDLTVTLPLHQANDIFLLMAFNRDVDETATVLGWTAFTGSPWDRGISGRYWLWWKRAASGSETNPLVDFSGTTGDAYAIVAVYRGATSVGTPWEVVGTLTTGTADPAVLTGITTLTKNSLIVVPLAGEDNNNAIITTTGTDPANYTEHYTETPLGADFMFGFSEAARTTAGATGNVSVDFDTAVPVGWGAVVLALKPPVPTYDQSAYRLFNNTDSTDVGTALALQDTAATLGSGGAAFRLRMLLHVGTDYLPASGENFKLQFVGKGTGTCASPSGGTPSTYTDVTTTTVIAYNDNLTPADGAALTANANDPTHGTDTIVNQTYEELNNFTNSQAAIPSGQDGKWDFSLRDNSAPVGTTYCFRAVKSDDTVLNTYTVFPEISTVPQTLSFSLGANSVALGTLSATAVTSGSHTVTVETNAASGVAITFSGPTLTSGAHTIAAMSTAAPSSPGTSQFGINAKANTTPSVGAECSGTTPIAVAATGYNTANNFKFVSGETIVSSTGAINTTTCTISYIANISGVTAAGSYESTLTYIATATF